jgi:hypothetical protein
MAGKGNTNDANILKLIFQAVAIANIADNASSSPLVNLFVSLHTADPGPTGDQTTSEATYTGYGRVAVARTSSGWSISAQTISNVGAITFPLCTGGSNTITHVAVGTLTSGAGVLLYSGALSASLAVSNGITPSFAAGQLTTVES